jgi:hypothetical protein
VNKVRISVEQADLYRAERGVSTSCAVSQAIAREIPGASRIDVDTQTIRFTLDDSRLVYLTPLLVQQYVSDFDAGLPIGTANQPGKLIGPFTFQLRDPIRAPRRIGGTGNTNKRTSIKASGGAPIVAGKRIYPDGRYQTPPPRVFRTKRRTYGHRVLRWNQEENAGA